MSFSAQNLPTYTTSFRLRSQHGGISCATGAWRMESWEWTYLKEGILTHGSHRSISPGFLYKAHSYGLNEEERIDMEQVRELAVQTQAQNDNVGGC